MVGIVARTIVEGEFEGDTMSQAKPFPVVAIGASPGGFEALERFISALPEDFDFALVFIQHFSPKHRNLIPHLLLGSRKPRLEIVDAADGLEIHPGRLYLCPPSAWTTMEQGVFRISPRKDDRGHLPVDEFFASLAKDMGERSIAVILSGRGSDGAKGVLAIRASGGTVFVQDPATAENGQMPMAAINTGQMDGVLPPEEIAREIVKLHSSGMDIAFPDAIVEQTDLDVFHRILHEKTGYRFDHYKTSVVARRIRRRMYLHAISSAPQYLEMLSTKEGEAGLLASDLMIGVTSFFRDRVAWGALREDVARNLALGEDDPLVRVWCAACATGEEAYSIAMLLHEEIELSGAKKDIQIFATDVNEQALERAREGVYPSAVLGDMPPGYMGKFFSEPRENLVSVSKDIRRHVLFAKHDILSDPPFSRIDLVICRNLLIYLEQPAQDKCIALFHYVLKKGGYLFLGGAESPGGNSRLFAALAQKKCRLYRRTEAPVSTKALIAPFPASRPSGSHVRQAPTEGRRSTSQFVHEALLEEFAPPAVAVDADCTILFHNGPTHKYLRHPRGVTTENLIELLPKTAGGRVKNALHKAGTEKKTFSVDVMIPMDRGQKKRVTIRASRLRDGVFLVVFREKAAASRAQAPEDIADELAVHQLEHELSVTRDELRRYIEQIKSVNEELESSNEEFQAANEELETSKEELQSLNEELTSVNAQLQTKIAEEERTSNDLNNFLASTTIPTVFLDENLRIKRFTPAMAKLLSLIPGDVGRPISDLITREHLGPHLILDAKAVLDDLTPVKRAFDAGPSSYIRTVLPYRTSDNRIEGVVITYTDITEIRAAEERSRHLASFPLLNPNPVIEVDVRGTIVFINPSANAVLDASGLGRDNPKALLPDDMDALLENWDRATELTVFRDVRVGDRFFELAVQLVPRLQAARIYGRDITKRKEAEDALQASEHRIRLKLKSILSPDGDLGDLTLIDIMDSPVIQSLMSNFYGLVPISMTVVDLEGRVVVGEGSQEICTKFHRVHPDTRRNCLESDLTLTTGIAPGRSRLYRCKNNMWDVATPIMIGGRHMGNVCTGQFFFDDETVDYDMFREQARKYGFPEEEYLAALDAVPRLSRKVVAGSISHFAILTDTLSLLSYSNIELARVWSQGQELTFSLQKSEERLRTAEAIAHVGSWDFDLSDNRLSWSEEVYRILGHDAQLDPSYPAFLERVHPDDRQMISEAYPASLRSRQDSYEISHRIVRKNTGEVRFVRQKCEHFRDPNGRVVRSVGIVHDITELKSRESRITALSRLYEVLSRVNEAIVRIGDERSLLVEVCRIVSDLGGFPLVWIGRADGDLVLALSSYGPAEEYLQAVKAYTRGDLADSPLSVAIKENRPVITDDFDAHPATGWPWREAAVRYGFRSSAALPLRRRGTVFGAFTIYSTETGVFDAEQVALLETLSADISHALETFDAENQRTMMVAELGRAKDQWERTFDSVPDMIAILDRNHRIVRMNAPMAKRLGLRQDDCMGLSCFEAVHGMSEPPPFCPHALTMKDCLGHAVEIYDERLGGDFEISTTPVYEDGGDLIGSVHVVHDVTGRKRHETDREWAVQFLSLINKSTTRKELIHETIMFFHSEMKCEAVAVRMKEGEDFPCFEALGFPDDFCPRQTGLCAPGHGGEQVDDDGGGPVAECMCRNVIEGRIDPSKPFFTPKGTFYTNSAAGFLSASDGQGPQRLCIGQGCESILLIALRAGRQCLGLLQLGDRHKDVMSRDMILTMERLSGYLAIALGKLNAEEELKSARDELEHRVEERTVELREAYDKLMEGTRERERVEAQLRQAQKMDALGTLTGGVAHDFNNILAAILGFTDMVRGHLPEGSRDAKSLERVMQAGIRGRELIKQMLSFSRKGDVEKRPMLPGAIIRETMEMIRASIPTTISIRVNVDAGSGKIMGDPIQIQQVLMNLCTNAAYAMREKGGILDIVLSDFTVCEKTPNGPVPGSYVRLTVRDTGEGIPAGDIDRIFDPFFTTKKRGEGTGLGLSVVHGIVHQLEGHITVESRPEKGTVFCVDFPKIVESDRTEKTDGEISPAGNERILFVDDERLLVQLAQEILEELGYRVVSYTGSRAALACFKLDPSQFDVVITDQTMPELTGIDLAREVMAIRPDLPVVLCTGYSHQVNSEAAIQAGIRAFVMKPLTKRELARVLRQVLEGR